MVQSDETQNNGQVRYGYDGTTWVFRYKINDTPFTEAQNAAINSGSTADDIINLREHLEDIDNPHNVTKSQVGLGNVDNTSDMEKPVSNPVKVYIKTVFAAPDYARAESVNRISQMGGTWIADRSGYVDVHIVYSFSTPSTADSILIINNREVIRDRIPYLQTNTVTFIWSRTAPVCSGDIIQLGDTNSGNEGIDYSCFFVPVRYIEITE